MADFNLRGRLRRLVEEPIPFSAVFSRIAPWRYRPAPAKNVQRPLDRPRRFVRPREAASQPVVQRCRKRPSTNSASCQPERQFSSLSSVRSEPSICKRPKHKPSARGSALSATVCAGTKTFERSVISRPLGGSTNASRISLRRMGSILKPSTTTCASASPVTTWPCSAARRAIEPRFGRDDRRTLVAERQAGVGPMSGPEIGMRFNERAAVGEGRTVAGVQIGLRGQALGEYHVVSVEFDMPVFDAFDIDLRDRAPIDQARNRHQRAFPGDVVARREPKIATWQALAERVVGRDANRPHRSGLGMAGDVDDATAEPANGPGGA